MAATDERKLNATLHQDGKDLANARKKQLRTIGHALKPVVTVAGDGLSENVLAEINRALDDHELIKIKLALGDRSLKQACIADLCEKTGSSLIQTIGNIALVLRENKTAKKQLSNLKRYHRS